MGKQGESASGDPILKMLVAIALVLLPAYIAVASLRNASNPPKVNATILSLSYSGGSYTVRSAFDVVSPKVIIFVRNATDVLALGYVDDLGVVTLAGGPPGDGNVTVGFVWLKIGLSCPGSVSNIEGSGANVRRIVSEMVEERSPGLCSLEIPVRVSGNAGSVVAPADDIARSNASALIFIVSALHFVAIAPDSAKMLAESVSEIARRLRDRWRARSPKATALLVLALVLSAPFLAAATPGLTVKAESSTVCDVTGHCLQFVTVPGFVAKVVRVVPENWSSAEIMASDVFGGTAVVELMLKNASRVSYRLYAKGDGEYAVFRCSFDFRREGRSFVADGGCATEHYELAPQPAQQPERDTWRHVAIGAGMAGAAVIVAYVIYKIIKG